MTLSHLDHEEAEIEPVYLAHQGGPEMKAMGKAFAKVSPARGGRFFAWVSDGATRTRWPPSPKGSPARCSPSSAGSSAAATGATWHRSGTLRPGLRRGPESTVG